MFIGKGGYWEGRVGGQEGWFSCDAIEPKEVEIDYKQLPRPTDNQAIVNPKNSISHLQHSERSVGTRLFHFV